MKNWLKAFRLRTLPLAFSVILAGNAFAFGPSFNSFVFIFTLSTTLFLQILSNLANDYGDFIKGTDNDNRIGPERSLQSGAISKKQMKFAIISCSILSLLNGLILLYISFGKEQFLTAILFLVLGLICIGAAIKYTVGKGAYGYRALGDVAVFVFFGIIGVIGSYYLQTKTVSHEIVHIAVAYGLWCTAVLNLNNMRDVDNDIKHGKKTMAFILGFRGSKVYQVALILIPYFILIKTIWPLLTLESSWILFPMLISLAQIIAIVKANQRNEFDKWLKIQAITTFLNSITLVIFVYLQHA